MKAVVLVLSFLLSFFVTSVLLMVMWNDFAVSMFNLPQLNFVHAFEVNLCCRLMFQTFEFDKNGDE